MEKFWLYLQLQIQKWQCSENVSHKVLEIEFLQKNKKKKEKNMSNECKKIDDQNIKNGTSFVEDLRARIVAYFRQNFQTIYNSLFCRASKLHLL